MTNDADISVLPGVGNKADRVFDAIRSDIIACRLCPSEKLRINQLTEQYGVSLGAVREALSRLVADGLILAEPQRGYRVAPVDRRDLVDLTEARVRLEGMCLADAIRKGNLEWESRIVSAHHRLSHTPDRVSGDTARLNPEWAVAHGEFHEALVSACSNTWLLRLRLTLWDRSERYRHLSVPLDTRPEGRNVAAEHKAIYEATLARDTKAALSLMTDHLSATTKIILDAGVLAV